MINIRYKQPNKSQFNDKQQEAFLERFGIDVLKGDTPVRVIFESSKVEDSNFVSQQLYVTAKTTDFEADDLFTHEGITYKVMYGMNDFSGLTDFYISLENSDERNSKYN